MAGRQYELHLPGKHSQIRHGGGGGGGGVAVRTRPARRERPSAHARPNRRTHKSDTERTPRPRIGNVSRKEAFDTGRASARAKLPNAKPGSMPRGPQKDVDTAWRNRLITNKGMNDAGREVLQNEFLRGFRTEAANVPVSKRPQPRLEFAEPPPQYEATMDGGYMSFRRVA